MFAYKIWPNFLNMYQRDLKIMMMNWMNSREILIVYGARQVGKNTLIELFTSRFVNVQIF